MSPSLALQHLPLLAMSRSLSTVGALDLQWIHSRAFYTLFLVSRGASTALTIAVIGWLSIRFYFWQIGE